MGWSGWCSRLAGLHIEGYDQLPPGDPLFPRRVFGGTSSGTREYLTEHAAALRF